MGNKLTVAGVIVALGLGVAGLFMGDTVITNPTVERIEKVSTVGATAGNDFRSGPVFFYDGAADGGGVFASSTGHGVVAGTLTAANMRDNNVIRMVVNSQANQVLTLPATSTMADILPEAGMHRTWLIENATTTAATTLTILKGAGINLIGVDTNVDVIDGTERSVLDCWRRADHDWDCRMDELVNAD